MAIVAFAEGVFDGDRLVDEGADAIADLTAYALEGNTKVTVDDSKPHAHVMLVGDGFERAGRTDSGAGESIAQTTGAGARLEVGRAAVNAVVAATEPDDLIGAGKGALAAAYALREEGLLIAGAGWPQEWRAIIHKLK
jgi:hypothetical protein